MEKKMTKVQAINYIVSTQNGYLNELKDKIGSENLKALLLTGFIKRGKELSNKDSWKATSFAKRLSSSTDRKVSLFDRVRYAINKKI